MTTWMIVEDEPDVYEMLLAVSELLGNEGMVFVEGEEAIDWISDVDDGAFEGDLPDLALLDIRLPNEVSGPMVGERLRKSRIMGQIPIVLMTSYKLTAKQEKALIKQAGADMLLQKPLPSMHELNQTLQSAMAKRARMQQQL